MPEEIHRIFVTGHRNPDIDSLASSVALAELRRRQGFSNIEAICPGVMSKRAAYLFERFRIPVPKTRNDVYLRFSDIMDADVETIRPGTPLLDAVRILNSTGFPRLPIVDPNGAFVGMLSPLNLLSHLLEIGRDSGSSLTGRNIQSSIDLIAKVIEAEPLTLFEPSKTQDFKVYVAAMGIESFETHLPADDTDELAVICGDRPEIHLRALQRKIRLLIVTGEKSVEPLIRKEAELQKVSILKTTLDSAAVIRRLKFSMPVELFGLGETHLILNKNDRVRGMANKVLSAPEDVVPVVSDDGKFEGVVLKRNVTTTPPYRMILVDHNETEQSIPGVEEIPIIEVVDHHRIGMAPTTSPIRFTGDVVGSACTLVAAMFKSHGESLSPGLAGLLLGGIVSDTLNLKSPTTAPLDRRILEWLEKIAGLTGSQLMEELSRIESPLSTQTPMEVIQSDCKTYSDGDFKFALSQVEETNLVLLHQREDELARTMEELRQKNGYDFIGLLVTDAVRENSELLMSGSAEVMQNLPYRRIGDSLFALPGVLSRKKQLLPQILAVTAALSR